MKRLTLTFAAFIQITAAGQVWSGPVEEIMQIQRPRMQAVQEANIEAYIAAFADNAVIQPGTTAFRVEGKEAIRAHFVEFFRIYPKVRVLARQPSMRVFSEELVISNSYAIVYLTDQGGNTTVLPIRSSATWTKVGGEWKIVDQHDSRPPMTP
jgi:uncharacterized protein (TIGR02246 family)